MAKLPITGDEAANRLLEENPLALMIGMLLDQQVPMEWAFSAPKRLEERIGTLDASTIAAMGPEKVDEVFREKPALHRFPGSMGKRTYELCRVITDDYAGRAETVWTTAADGADLLKRLRDLPGYGDEKSRIFIALLAKRFGVTPQSWQDAAAPFSDSTPRSVADVDSAEAFERVRQFKKAQKAKGKGKAD